MLVRRGEAVLGSETSAMELRARDLVLVQRDDVIWVSAKVPLEIFCIYFDQNSCFADPDGAAFFAELLSLWPTQAPLMATEDIMLATAAVCAASRGAAGITSAAAIATRGRFLSLLALIYKHLCGLSAGRAARKGGGRFQTSLGYIEANVERRLEVAELASIAGLSPRRYSAVFRHHTGQSVARYVRSMRVRFAKSRLVETRDILQASMDAGFADLSNFYRVFKSEAGVTPRQFIDSQRAAVPAPGGTYAAES